MHTLLKPLVLGLALAAVACEPMGEIESPSGKEVSRDNVPNFGSPNAAPVRWRTARLWIESHVDLDQVGILKGANGWNKKGAQAVIVPKSEAQIRITTSNDPCVDGAKDNPPSAHAFPNGDIIVYVNRCNDRDENGRIRFERIMSLIMHEVGHQLGVWDHVPGSCDQSKEKEAIKVHPSGVSICGDKAVMNGWVGALELTLLDELAYDMRSSVSVIDDPDHSTSAQALTVSGGLGCEMVVPSDMR